MSVSASIVEYMLKRGAGVRLKAADILDGAAFEATREAAFMALAALSQPGRPLQREKVDGVFWYELRPGVNCKPYLDGSYIRMPRIQESASASPPGHISPSKSAAAQAPCRTPASSPGPAAKPDSANRGESANTSAASAPSPDENSPAAKPAPAAATLFLPIQEPNPHRAEVLRFIEDLRIRRSAIDEVIQLLESTFKVKP